MLKRIYRFIQDKAYRVIGLNYRLTSGYDITIKNKMEWIIYNDIFVEGDYDEAILDALGSGHQTVNILDLGGNVGYFELRVAHLRHVIGGDQAINLTVVEGSRDLFLEMKRRLQPLIQTKKINLKMHHGLAGKRSGAGTLFQFSQHGLNSLSRKEGKPVNVDFLDIDTLCQEWQTIDLIKCDIEGSELLFIENYPDLIRKARAIVIEFHPEFCDPVACQQLLSEQGFRINKLIKDYGNCSIHLLLKP